MKTLYIKAENQEQTEAIICPHCRHEHLYSWETAGFYQHAFLSCYVCGAGFTFPTLAVEMSALDDKQTATDAHIAEMEGNFLQAGSLRVRQN